MSDFVSRMCNSQVYTHIVLRVRHKANKSLLNFILHSTPVAILYSTQSVGDYCTENRKWF